MSEVLNAVDQIKSWAKKNQAIINLAAELERIGSLEQAADEAAKRQAQAYAEADKARSTLEAVNAAIVEGRKQCESARFTAEQTINQGRTAAHEISEAAKAAASETLDKAERTAKEIIGAAVGRQASIAAEINKAGQVLAQVKADCEAVKLETQRYSAELDKKREAARKLMSGLQ